MNFYKDEKLKTLICPHCEKIFTEAEMLESLVNQKMSLTQIAKKLGVSKPTAWRKLTSNGFQFKKGWYKR